MPVPKLEVKSVPIAYILQNLGYELRGRGEMFCSPLREDANPSFHINSKSNVWYDHGLGEGGDNIRLVQRLTGKSYHDALEYIAGLQNIDLTQLTVKAPIKTEPSQPQLITTKICDLRNPFLLDYARERGICDDLLRRCCKEVHFKNYRTNRDYFAIGFPNDRGGYVLRNKFFKATTKGGITTIGADGALHPKTAQTRSVLMFEGFFDYLSFLQKRKQTEPGTDAIILNSTANLAKSYPQLKNREQIECYFDNDKAGTQAIDKLHTQCPGIEICDHRREYADHKDLNAQLISETKLETITMTVSSELKVGR